MKKRLISSLRITMALFVAVFATNLPVASVFADTLPASSDANQASYWESESTGTCTKLYDDGSLSNTTSYVLGTPQSGEEWTLLVINGGTLDETYANPQAGETYYSAVNPKNPNGVRYGISHIILCSKPITPPTVTNAVQL
jgi:hypothetical protein